MCNYKPYSAILEEWLIKTSLSCLLKGKMENILIKFQKFSWEIYDFPDLPIDNPNHSILTITSWSMVIKFKSI